MRAIILAAGRGSRLGGLTADLPKALLPVEGEDSLLDLSLAALAAAGVARVSLVVGFAAEKIRARLAARPAPLRVDFIDNPHWAETGSVASLLLALEEPLDPWTLVVESDLLYHPDFPRRALAQRRDTILVADATGSGDEVWILADGAGRLTLLGKRIPPGRRGEAVGEFAGISLFSRELLQIYRVRAQAMLAAGAATGHYEELVFDIAQTERPVSVLHLPGLPWTEVDNAADLDRARGAVWPRLRPPETRGL
ncbi:MAG: NTP transferase domain-containing protein [Rhodospirillaceae bacterium]